MKSHTSLVITGVGTILFLLGMWGLCSGKVLTKWAQLEYRPSVPYWITVVVLLAGGAINVAIGIWSYFRTK